MSTSGRRRSEEKATDDGLDKKTVNHSSNILALCYCSNGTQEQPDRMQYVLGCALLVRKFADGSDDVIIGEECEKTKIRSVMVRRHNSAVQREE